MTRSRTKPERAPSAGAAEADAAHGADGRTRKSALRENYEAVLVAVLFAVFVRGFIAQPYKIPSGSMEESLLVGDHLVVNKVLYGEGAARDGMDLLPTEPVQRGDVVIFRPVHDPETDYIKRVIGLPGEEITLTYSPQRNGVRVLVDGKPIPESYRLQPGGPVISEPGALWTVNNAGEPTERTRRGWRMRRFQLGSEQYLMLGDNRNHSADSRWWGDDFAVDAERIRGRAWFIYWSYRSDEPEPVGFTSRLVHYLRIAWGFFGNSRWSRTFQLIR